MMSRQRLDAALRILACVVARELPAAADAQFLRDCAKPTERGLPLDDLARALVERELQADRAAKPEW